MSLSSTTRPDLTIRPALPADATDLARIYTQGIEDRTSTFETRPRTAEDILTWFDGQHPIQVAEQDGQLIAFASTGSYRAGVTSRFMCPPTLTHSSASIFAGKNRPAGLSLAQ